ncbi:MAG: helicase RepA family protein [Acidobacteria bacterium]|nr:helicase RepA family protein [Acidobacteriota bacterium]
MAINPELRAFLTALCHVDVGGVTEVCVFQGGKKPTHVGYFDNLETAAKAIEAHDGSGNIFVTLNPARRDLLARANNHLVEGSYKNPSERTKDTEIHCDSWFFLDVDPKRPSGISSTDDELSAALDTAKAARDWLLSVVVPAGAILTAMSGNGAYVLVRLPDYEVTDQRTATKKSLINFIADKFDNERVEIDRTVYNPARLVCALGTMKVKGENIEERPHRRSAVRTIASESFDLAKEQRCEPFDLYALAGKIIPATEKKTTKENSSSAGEAYTGFDARKIAHLLQNHKPTSNGFDRYDCPSCGNTQKLWVRSADGKYGCYEPGSVCDWRKLRQKVLGLAVESGIVAEAQAGAENGSQSKADVATVLSRIVTAQTILETKYPEPKWAVKGIIPEGTTFIAGPPKLGKSIFALNIAVAVSEGGKALSHFDVEQGSVLYLALEDGERRIQARLRKLTDGKISDRLGVVTKWPRLNQGGLEAIEEWIKRHTDARLIIVDTLKMLRGLRSGHNQNVYDADYEDVSPLTELTTQFCLALGIVTHTRKAIADDPLATVSGSFGLTGAADGVLVLARKRNSASATLSVIGRDVEEQELALEFKPDKFLWSVLGKADEIRRSKERREVIDLLTSSSDTLSPGEIAGLLNRDARATSSLLWKMKDATEVKLFGKKYQLPDYKPPEPETAKKSAKKSQKTKSDKNINASTAMNSGVDGQNTNRANGLDAPHQHINDVTKSGELAEDAKGDGKVSQSVDALMRNTQPLHTQELGASTSENITDDALMPQTPTNRKRVTI